jgi:hypothetical protein
MHIRSQALLQIGGRYTDTQETEMQKKLRMLIVWLLETTLELSSLACKDTLKKHALHASMLVELFNYKK